MEVFEAYTSALAFSAALLLVAALLAKKQLVWKRRAAVPARRRSSFSRFTSQLRRLAGAARIRTGSGKHVSAAARPVVPD
jgi:hypothetical protein